MKKKEIPIIVDFKDFGQQKALKFNVNSIIAKEFCMMFFLLKENLVKKIELKLKNYIFFVETEQDIDIKESFCVIDQNEKVFKGTLSANSLDFVIHFLLKYFRDEIGEAEHIDVDFKNQNGGEVTLTIKCDIYREFSSAEIIDLLG